MRTITTLRLLQRRIMEKEEVEGGNEEEEIITIKIEL